MRRPEAFITVIHFSSSRLTFLFAVCIRRFVSRLVQLAGVVFSAWVKMTQTREFPGWSGQGQAWVLLDLNETLPCCFFFSSFFLSFFSFFILFSFVTNQSQAEVVWFSFITMWLYNSSNNEHTLRFFFFFTWRLPLPSCPVVSIPRICKLPVAWTHGFHGFFSHQPRTNQTID